MFKAWPRNVCKLIINPKCLRWTETQRSNNRQRQIHKDAESCQITWSMADLQDLQQTRPLLATMSSLSPQVCKTSFELSIMIFFSTQEWIQACLLVAQQWKGSVFKPPAGLSTADYKHEEKWHHNTFTIFRPLVSGLPRLLTIRATIRHQRYNAARKHNGVEAHIFLHFYQV